MATSFYVFSMQSSRVLLLLYLSLSVDSISFKFRIDELKPDEKTKLYQEDLPVSAEANDPDSKFYVIHATYTDPVPIWDSKTRELTDFSTHFTFTADTRRATTYGGGLTFFLAPIGFQIPPNSAGAFLGLYNKLSYTNSSQNQIVHVEFDTSMSGWNPPFEHVGINVNSLTSSKYTRWLPSPLSGDIADVLISYNSTTKNLSVAWEYQQMTSTSSVNNFLTYQIDLRDVLPQQAIVGFSAATSAYLETTQLYSWEFNSTLAGMQTSKTDGNKVKVNVVEGVIVSIGVVLIVMAII